jgi:hypothetical protein
MPAGFGPRSILSRNENTLAASAKTADRIADQLATAPANLLRGRGRPG